MSTLIASLLPWWTDSATSMGYTVSASASAWHRFWWIGPLIAVAVGIVYALVIVKAVAAQPKTLLLLAGGGFASFVLTLISLIDTISRPTGMGVPQLASPGPSAGVFLALVTTAVLCYFGALAAQDAGARLPIVIPGPRRE
ncbi:hypothetical protein [Nocardia sp. BMG111209]|uniref:hypothetical protein n=1 Tax=Nocardia sp. BMG111209 TaxID=1160137 RepID=UPI0012DE7AA5|nr:hypothetical protein [Nocardia sp. BMG111209]